MIKKRKGLALIAAVMLVVFITMAVLGLSTFIVQWFLQLNADQINAKCLYLAQAGIQDAIYEIRSSYLNPATTYGSFTTGLTTVNTGETYRRGGTAADFLLVNTAGAAWNAATFILSGINVQKATSSAIPAVTIASVNVCWTRAGGPNRNIDRITIGGATWTGNLPSLNCPGRNADIADVTLNTSFIPVTLRWSNSITLTDVIIQFNMTDGSTKTVDLWDGNLPTPPPNNCLFTIKSTGKVSGSNIYRTIQADYNLKPTTYAAASRIDNINEINTEITSP